MDVNSFREHCRILCEWGEKKVGTLTFDNVIKSMSKKPNWWLECKLIQGKRAEIRQLEGSAAILPVEIWGADRDKCRAAHLVQWSETVNVARVDVGPLLQKAYHLLLIARGTRRQKHAVRGKLDFPRDLSWLSRLAICVRLFPSLELFRPLKERRTRPGFERHVVAATNSLVNHFAKLFVIPHFDEVFVEPPVRKNHLTSLPLGAISLA